MVSLSKNSLWSKVLEQGVFNICSVHCQNEVNMCVKYFQNWTNGYRYGADTNSVHVIIDLHYDLDFEAGCPKPSLGRILNMVDISVKYNHNQTEDFKILGKIKTSQTDIQMERQMDKVKTGYPSRHLGHKLE